MKGAVEGRAIELGEYIIENNATVRAAAKKFHISKSTVHKDVSDRLRVVNPQLYVRVRSVLDINKAQRHIRGGNATRDKYREEARKRETAASCASRTQNKTGRPEGKPVPQI